MISERTNGPAAAAILAAGIGVFVLGLFTVLAAANEGIKNAITFYNPSGPLSGKTTLGVLAWLISWPVLHFMWGRSTVNLNRIMIVALALVALGVLFTFPPVYEAFEA